MARRPEHLAPPEIFYNEEEARKYTSNTRIIDIQVQMCERAVELLALPEDEPHLILDIGCGSGLSGSVLEDQGHTWIGLDIAPAMLEVAVEREVEGDLVLGDMGQGVPFKAGTFDGAISISALQWLCNADKKSHNPQKRLYKFFSSLFSCLTRSARAVFQFYPENASQIELVTSQAMKAGFLGGLVVDFPNSAKAKKYFLVLMTGGVAQLPQALGTEGSGEQVDYAKKREMAKRARGKPLKKSRDWILAKKERRRRQGKETRADTRKCLNLSSAQTHIPSRCISRTNDLFQVKNHYDVLGLTPKATQNDIKAAYYKLSMLYHPDKNKGSDEVVVKKFRDITAAYEVLGTYRLRKLYDKGILQPSAGPVPPPEPEFKSPTDVQPDDDAQTKFYKSRFKRSEVPDGTPIYDFDTWSREHYGSTLNRSQKAKAKYEKIVSDTGQSKGYSHVEILLFGGLVLIVLVVYVNYEESLNDMVKNNDKGALKRPEK